MYCSSCGSKISDSAKFCKMCGMPVIDAFETEETVPEQPEESILYCPYCGKDQLPDAIFCDRCGKRIVEEAEADKEKSAEETVTVPESLPISELPVIESNIEQKANICPNCGAVIEEGYVFCDGCGTRVVQTADSFYNEEEETRITDKTEEAFVEHKETEDIDALIARYQNDMANGDKEAQAALIELATENIENYNAKITRLCEFETRWRNEESFSPDETRELIELSIQILRYIPSFYGRLMFMGILMDNPYYMYKKGGIVPVDFCISIFDKLNADKNGDDDFALTVIKTNPRDKAFFECRNTGIDIQDIEKTNWAIFAGHVEEAAKKAGWDGEYRTSELKPVNIRKSFLYERMHSLRETTEGYSKTDICNVLASIASVNAESFVKSHSDFTAKDELMVVRALIAGDDQRYKYRKYLDMYPDTSEAVEIALDTLEGYAVSHTNDNEALSLFAAFKAIGEFNSNQEIDDLVRVTLLRVLHNEEDAGTKDEDERAYLVTWIETAFLVDFEEWYEHLFNDKL